MLCRGTIVGNVPRLVDTIGPVTLLVLQILIATVERGDVMLPEDAAQRALHIEIARDIQIVRRGHLIIVTLGFGFVTGAGATIKGRTAHVGIGFSHSRHPRGIAGKQIAAQIERDDRVVEQVLLTAAEILMVEDSLNRKPVMKQGLSDGDIIRVPVLPLALIITVEQFVEEIEDRGIGQRFVVVLSRPQIATWEWGVGRILRRHGIPLTQAGGIVGLRGHSGITLGVNEVLVAQAKAGGSVVLGC